MNYMLLLTRGAWQDEGADTERREVFEAVGAWFAKHRDDGTIIEANKLDEPHTATTVVIERGASTLVDRPLLEAKEAIGGYAVVDVPDLDAAVALARSFPVPDGRIEVRPVDLM